MYEYAAVVLDVHDGDTVTLQVDVGFSTFVRNRFRLVGIDTPELRSPQGQAARGYLLALLASGPVMVETIKQADHEKREKYGRWLATLYVAGVSVNQQMLDAGHAVPYDGGPRG